MYISDIELTNFRNYTQEKAEFSKGINVIYGENAQGKTNLLEAVYMFAAGKSFRTQNDMNLIKFGEKMAKISINFESERGKSKAQIILSDKKKKLIKLRDLPLKKTGELLGQFRAVLFCPEELSLISGSPDTRRRFLDMYISSQKPIYYGLIKTYNKILRQKNALLKSDNDDSLFVWNQKLAETAAQIMEIRRDFISDLSEKANTEQKKISLGKEELFIKYVPSVSIDEKNDREEIKEILLYNIKKKEFTEKMQGAAVIGIHRDDMEFIINGKSAKLFASQGQQRSAVISLKNAQTELIKSAFFEYPVLLLDDVLSELDSSRKEFLTDKFSGKQVIITSTDKILNAGQRKVFLVKDGSICTCT